jgi:hypothetical protein
MVLFERTFEKLDMTQRNAHETEFEIRETRQQPHEEQFFRNKAVKKVIGRETQEPYVKNMDAYFLFP